MNPPDLDRMTIASPCTASWDAMAGDDRKRFCGDCRLHVYNLAAMTRAEADDLVQTTGGRLCARIFRRPDGTVLTRDCIPLRDQLRRRAARVRGVAAALLAGCVGLFAAACGRTDVATTPAETPAEIPDPDAPAMGLIAQPVPQEMGEFVDSSLLGRIGPPPSEDR